MSVTQVAVPPAGFEVRFESLYCRARSLAFPCDEEGRVDIDALSERGRNNYFLARAMIGRDYATPRVVSRGGATSH
jgi:hypothetical protein